MNVEEMLRGGDRRSIGDAPRVAELVLRDPNLTASVVTALHSRDPVIRSRAAHVLKRVSMVNPGLVASFKRDILSIMPGINQWEVREQYCQILPGLPLNQVEVNEAVQHLHSFLDDRSSILRTCALQALADLAQLDTTLKAQVKRLLERFVNEGTAAMRARCRILMRQF